MEIMRFLKIYKNMKRIFALFSMLLFLLSFACVSVKEESDDVVYMSVILPFNENPVVASEMYKAMKLAESEVNASRDRMGGKELKLDIRSDGVGIYETSRVLQSMLESKVDILHIGVRDAMIFKQEALGASDKFINYMNDYAPATLKSENAVRVFLSATQVCEEMAKVIDKDLLEEKAQLRTVGLARNDLMSSSALAYLKFEVATNQIKFEDEYFKKGETNFDILAEQIKALKADYIFAMGSPEENANILRALNKLSFSWKVAFSARPSGGVGVGSYFLVKPIFSNLVNAKKESSTREFELKCKELYGKSPKHFEAYYAYDSIILAAKAYNEKPNKMRDAFLDKTFHGAVGTIEFDNTGDSRVEMDSSFSLLE